MFISPVSDDNWWSNLVVSDRQQIPPSLTFAHPKQIAKYLVVDQELLPCQIYLTSAMPITKYSSIIQISWHFYPPFTLIPGGAYSFSKFLGGLQDRMVIIESPITHSLINHLSRDFMNFAKQV